jgi:hypothetical protein
MFERFTDRARRVLVLAQEEARLLDHSFIGTEHILLGLIREQDGIAAQSLQGLDISLAAVRERVGQTIGLSASGPTGSPPFTPRAKKVLELSLREALQLGHTYIGPEHLLLGLVREGEGVAAQVLVSMGADLPRVRQQVIQLLSGYRGGNPPDSPAGASSLEGAGPSGQLVACSFCGSRPPGSGQLISGIDAFICERCIRQWFRRLETVDPAHSWRSVAMAEMRSVDLTGVVREGPQDPETARAEIVAAFTGCRTVSDDGQSIPTVEKGETLGPILVAANQRQAGIAPETADVTIAVDEITFFDATHAATWISITVDGRTMLQHHRGDALVVEGVWKVARSTFCGLMAMAGVPCPPEPD